MKRAPLRRALYVLIWLTALAPPIAALSYFLYADLLNPRSTQQVAGPYDGFYWDAAQFQIAFVRLENQVLLYKAGLDTDYQNVKLRYQILQSKLHKRGVPLKALTYGTVEDAAGSTKRQRITLQDGIPMEKAKEMVRLIKDSKIKVQASIQEKQVRVSGKNRDDLQAVIALVKSKDLGVALQFTNYRST